MWLQMWLHVITNSNKTGLHLSLCSLSTMCFLLSVTLKHLMSQSLISLGSADKSALYYIVWVIDQYVCAVYTPLWSVHIYGFHWNAAWMTWFLLTIWTPLIWSISYCTKTRHSNLLSLGVRYSKGHNMHRTSYKFFSSLVLGDNNRVAFTFRV